ncbi:MAG: hypothetical protein HPY64_13235 [Anaerolineae bacterium]|nr:hypothetical protein [Anaerolineae bacterium]
MRPLRLLIAGLVFAGLSLLLISGILAAQGGDEATYIGGSECRSCHRGLSRDYAGTLHARALQDTRTDKAAILADFAAGEDVRTVLLPSEDAPRPFTADDIAYAVGGGRYLQRYLYDAGDGRYIVLPAQWNVAAAAWEPLALAEEWPAPAYDWGASCAYCHTTALDTASYTWLEDGVQCEACHGPGSVHVSLADAAGVRPRSDELAAIRGAIVNTPDPQICGQCHAVGKAPDGHPYPVGYRPGEPLDESYTISTPGDESDHWWPTGHAADVGMQFNEWFHSAHARALETARSSNYADDACLGCHSGDYRYVERVRGWFAEGSLDGEPPEALTLQTAALGVVCGTCHNPHAEGAPDFFLAEEPEALCAGCHSNTGESVTHHPQFDLYQGLPLVAEVPGIPSAHFSAAEGPDCLSCHMARLPVKGGALATHSLLAVLPGAPEALEAAAGCTTCHDAIGTAQLADFISDVQADFAARLEVARAALRADAPGWVEGALDAVESDGSGGLHNYSYSQALLSAAEAALGIGPQAPAAAVYEAPPAWVELPLLGMVEGLTLPGLLAGGAGTLILLIGGVILLFGKDWRRLVGILLIVAAIALATAPWWALERPRGVARASGDDGYCLMCHAGERSLTLVDGNTISLKVDPAAMDASVHGVESSRGQLGCLDCHSAAAFPHGPAPTSLREYRLAGVPLCAGCHQDSLGHYEEVRAKNIAVGCVDCHGAHAVAPAETLSLTPPPRPPEIAPGASALEVTPTLPGEPPVVRQPGG